MRILRSPVLALLAASLACAVTEPDVADSVATDRFRAGGPELPTWMKSTPAELQATAAANPVFLAGRLAEVASNLAERHRGLSGETPLGVTYLRDLDGEIAALSVTYALRPDVSHPSAAGLSAWIASQTQQIDNDLAAGGVPLEGIRDLRLAEDYLNVVVGARPSQPRLLSLSNGLAVEVYQGLGRRAVARELGIALAAVSVGEPFWDSRMSRGSHLGFRFEAGGTSMLYLVPSPGAPAGRVVPEGTFLEHRTTLLAEYKDDLALAVGASPSEPLEKLLERNNAEAWGRLLGHLDAKAARTWSAPCPNCGMFSQELMDVGLLQFQDWVLDAMSGTCDCTATYLDGAEVTVDDCDDLSDCCDLEDGELPPGTDPADCLDTCECDCQGVEWQTIHYDHVLRGVPNLFQHLYDIPWTPFCADEVAVGCGPLAAAELMIWHDKLGYDELLDHHHNTDGAFLWQDLAEELRDDYLGSDCIGIATATQLNPMGSGMFDYIWDQGLSASVQNDRIRFNDVPSGWATITNEIEANNPLVLAFNTDSNSGLGQGGIDHYAVITGHSTLLGIDEIHLNMGWGTGSTEVLEWDVPVGKVHLYSVNIADPATGGLECMVDTPVADLFAESPGSLEWSANSSTYDTYPVVEDLSGSNPPDCDRIGGETSGYYSTSWTERRICLTPSLVERLDTQIAEQMEELGDLSDPPEWIWE